MAEFDCQAFMAGVRREAGERGREGPDWRTLAALLRLKGGDFVLAAYRAILKREADPVGLRNYAPQAEHLAGRLCIIFSLLLSPEQADLPSPLRRALATARQCLRRLRTAKQR